MTSREMSAALSREMFYEGENMEDTQRVAVSMTAAAMPDAFREAEVAPEPKRAAKSLFSKNVRIGNKRTSVRLEPQMWQALNEIAVMEKCTIHQLCTAVNDLKKPLMPFTAALRVFLMEYYRSAARISPEVTEIRKMISGGA